MFLHANNSDFHRQGGCYWRFYGELTGRGESVNSHKFFSLVVWVGVLLGLLVGRAWLAQATPALAAGDVTSSKVTGVSAKPARYSPAQVDLTSGPGRTLPPSLPSRLPLLQGTVVLTVTKSAENAGGDPLRPGERITYTITISNSGDITATNVVVSDTFPANTNFVTDSVSISPPSAGSTPGTQGTQPIIASGITVTAQSLVTVTYAVTVTSPLTNGTVITNTASVTSTEVPTPTTGMVTNTVIEYAPALSLTKTGPVTATVGQGVIYTFTVTNDDVDGDGSPLSDVTLEDNVAGAASYIGGDDDGDDLLEVGESWVYTVGYTIPATVTNLLVNTATVAALDGDGDIIDDSDSHSLDVEFNPALRVVKSGPIAAHVGDLVTFGFNVTNDVGNGDGTPINNILVSDDHASSVSPLLRLNDDGDDWLEVGETWIYIASYTIRATDPNLLTNTVTVAGQDIDGEPVSDTDAHTTDIEFEPALTITKDGPATASVGETVSYTFTVSHAGTSDDSSVSDVTVTDSVAGVATRLSGDASGDDQLDADETWIYTVDYTVPPTVTDPLTNTATVVGKDKDDEDVTASDDHSMAIEYAPVLAVSKSGPATANLDQTVDYTFNVSHAGTSDGSPVSDLTVTDSLAGLASLASGDANGNDQLEVGETWTYTASYTVLASDPDPLVNTATVVGKDQDGDEVTAGDSHSLDIEYVPALTVAKNGPTTADVGETVEYTFSVSHAGSSDGSPVGSVTVSDDVAGAAGFVSGDTNGNDQLELGETWIYSAGYTVLITDPDPLVNTATVLARDRDDDEITADDSHSLDIGFAPALTITKSGPITATADSPITYTLTVTNSGQATANDLLITDAIPVGATYVSGGTKVGDVVRWTVPSLAQDSSTQVTFVVKAFTDIINSDYGVVAAGNVSAAGEDVVETTVLIPPHVYRVYLPLVFKSPPTELSVFNDNTGGNVTFTVLGTGVSCTVPNNTTQFCGAFPPGTYNVRVNSACGDGVFSKTYASGPVTTRVFCK